MTQFTIYTANTTGVKQNKLYPNEVTVDNLSALEQAMRWDHVCAKYTGNERGNANFQYSDCIPMDCDNDHSDDPATWKTPEDVQAAFPGVAFAVSFSRNHMKEKNGKAARPKFHCYFPIKRISSAEQYAAMKRQLQKLFPEFDANTLDAGRFYFGVEQPRVRFFEGDKTVDELFYLAGNRNDTLYRRACELISGCTTLAKAEQLFQVEAAKCIPPLDGTELASIWRSAKKTNKSAPTSELPQAQDDIQERLAQLQPEKNPQYPWTELGAGRLFADIYKNVVRYVPERKKWFYYDGRVWKPDEGELCTMDYCMELANQLLYYCVTISDERTRKEYIDFCKRWQGRRMRETILKDARVANKIEIMGFDNDPYIFNCQNGTLHLDTMQFTEHRPEDMLTKLSEVVYDPNARCERFEKFVDEIMCGDQETAAFLQKVLGYGLCGDTRHECFYIFYGAKTRNGKGTLCESVLKVMGDYGCTAKPETIGVKQNNSSHLPSEDVARLAGVRFVNISEPGRGLMLDAALVKSMTGNDTLNARFLHENSFDFKPQFKIYMNTNYRPAINDLTLFSSGRVVIVLFDRHFEESEQDKNLKALFAKPQSQSAIFNWLIEGCRRMLNEKLVLPERVKAAIAEYHKDSDKIQRFAEEGLLKRDKAEVRTAQVYQAYKDWCEDNGCRAESMVKFKQALSGFAEVVRKRPAGGGNETTVLLNYQLVNPNTDEQVAQPL